MPSLSEGMPLAVLEAFASGKPVVGTTAGGIPELVGDGRFGILAAPSDPEAFAQAMEAAMDRTWDADLLRARARSQPAHRGRQALRRVQGDRAVKPGGLPSTGTESGGLTHATGGGYPSVNQQVKQSTPGASPSASQAAIPGSRGQSSANLGPLGALR